MAKSNHVITTKDALEKEFHENGWKERLGKCVATQVDADFEYSFGTRSYRRQSLVKHYENSELIAFTIDYTLHDESQIRQLKMLLINGIRHIVP